jgi:hypothetical protein
MLVVLPTAVKGIDTFPEYSQPHGRFSSAIPF